MQPVLKLLAALLLAASPAWADMTVDQMDPAPNPLPGGTAIYCSILGLDCNLVEAPPGNLARLLGFYTTASGNVIIGNFTDSAGVAVEQPMPPCADTGTNGLVYDVTKTPRLQCGTSTLPAPTAGAITTASSLTASTASTTFVMAGFAQAITPAAYGRVQVMLNGALSNSNATTGTSTGGNFRICWGTGAAPSPGDAPPVGISCPGNALLLSANSTLITAVPGLAWIAGLALGTPIWIDLEIETIGAGTTATFLISNFIANEQ